LSAPALDGSLKQFYYSDIPSILVATLKTSKSMGDCYIFSLLSTVPALFASASAYEIEPFRHVSKKLIFGMAACASSLADATNLRARTPG
jgi:hypothetical protein